MRRLVIRPGAIGDFIVSLPAIECLRAGYLEVWAPGRMVPVVRFADRVRSIAATGLDQLGVADDVPPSLIEELRTFDSIVSWYGSNRPDFRELLASINPNCDFLSALPPEGTAIHAGDFYFRQVSVFGSCIGDGIPRIPCPRGGGNYAVIHPFSGSPRKNWPLENFHRLARELERTMPVQWCSGPEDPPLHGAVRIDNLYELACWLAGARLYVGNDSGITHLAAASGTPVLALFGPTDPGVWAPRGLHVKVVRWHSDRKGVSALQ